MEQSLLRNLFTVFAFGFVFNALIAQNENSADSTVQSVSIKSPNNRYGEMDDYRRSSLAVIMITHKGTKYAQQMEEQFKNMPMPSRYNEHNIDVRVISVSSKTKAKDVAKLLEERDVAKKLVSRWFNRDSQTGLMDMELIHARGGYGANYQDFMFAENTERGRSLLTDEGIELLKNTFVLVCDMDYYDREKTGQAVSAGLALLATGMNAYSQEQAKKGNSDNVAFGNMLTGLTAASSVAAKDIAGFSVSMTAYLFRLKWNNDLTQKIYSQYWVDASTGSDASSRIAAYNDDKSSFKLEYLGEYSSRSGKTVSKSSNDLNMVIRTVCATTMDEGMHRLSKMFPVFKPKTIYECVDDHQIAAYIGSKEGISTGQKYEILETVKKKDVIQYKKVGKAVANKVWNNKDHNFATDGLGDDVSGTLFNVTSGKDFCGPNYVIREAGKLGYSYKRKHALVLDLSYSTFKIDEDELSEEHPRREYVYEYSSKYSSRYRVEEITSFDFEAKNPSFPRLRMGWMVNFSQLFGYNVVNFDTDFSRIISFNTGIVFRTNTFGKINTSFFIWPTIGYNLIADIGYSYKTRYVNELYDGDINYLNGSTNIYSGDQEIDMSGFDWQVRLGVNITPKIYVAGSIGKLQNIGVTAGYMF